MSGTPWDRWRERLAFSTNAFKRATWHEAIRDIAAIGYAGVEVMADQPHFTPSEMSTSEVTELGDAIDERRLRCSNVNAFTGFFAASYPHGEPRGDTYHPTWLDRDRLRRDERVAHTLASIRLASAIGADSVSLQPGGPTVGDDRSRDELGRLFAEGVRRCLPTARTAEVTLAIEPEPGLFIETTAEYLAWKREHFADEPLVKMNFDVGHAFCVGEDPAAVATDLRGEYAHVHLEDIAATRVHQHLVPGQGAIDFRALFDALDRARYPGWVTVELYPFLDDATGVAARAYQHLQRVLSA